MGMMTNLRCRNPEPRMSQMGQWHALSRRSIAGVDITADAVPELNRFSPEGEVTVIGDEPANTPLHRNDPTLVAHIGTSCSCHNRTKAVQQKAWALVRKAAALECAAMPRMRPP
jgi:hypothetical protein